MVNENALVKERRRKLKELEKLGIDPYPNSYDANNKAAEILEKHKKLKKEQRTKDKVSVAGRIVSYRSMGKIVFAHLQDFTGKIQLFFRKDDLGKKYDELKLFDIGDIIGVKGTVFATKTGEISVHVDKFHLLTKSLRPLPEKFHGLKDPELRHRMRYVDLIMNPEVKEVFLLRTKIIDAMRKFLIKKGFVEVETPTLQPVYGGAAARPFTTHHIALNMNLFLRISNELYLKRLIVGGFEKVFEIHKDFRNEGIDHTHNPEFTMMETMQAYADYNTSMKVVEEMLSFISKEVHGTTAITYQGKKINLKPPFRRISMVDAVKKYTGADFSKVKTLEEARKIAKKLKVEVDEHMSIGYILAEICDELVEPKFIQPTFLTDFPKDVSPLAKAIKTDSNYTERFELIIGGTEYANVYSELNEPGELRKNWEEQKKLIAAGDESAQVMDEDFLKALEIGLPPTSGIGIGLDRLIMLFTNKASIRDVLFFPLLKPETYVEPTLAKDTMLAVAVINKAHKLKEWEKLNTVAHLNAAFGARLGKGLFMQDEITTKDKKKIKLNIQHAIMIKEAKSNKDILEVIKAAQQLDLDISEFTREMIEITDDRKVDEWTKKKNIRDIEYLGVLIFGKKSIVEKLTSKFKLYK